MGTKLLAPRVAILSLLAASLASPPPAAAQGPGAYRLSQWASVSQQLADTKVTVEYYRPLARGRSPVIGSVVHWGEVWTPGANVATRLLLSADATIEGRDVPAGAWSLWLIPSRVSAWELLLQPDTSLFHTQPPAVGAEGQIRIEVEPRTVPHVEALTWDFPEVDRHRGTLRMAWGETAVPLAIEVASNIPVTTVTAAEAARYVGEWRMTPQAPPEAQGEMPPLPPSFTLTIEHGPNGQLVLRLPDEMMSMQPPPPEPDPSASPRERERAEAARAVHEQMTGPDPYYYVALVPLAEGIFQFAFFFNDGTLIDIEPFFWEFGLEGSGEATTLLFRDEQDRVMGRGERVG